MAGQKTIILFHTQKKKSQMIWFHAEITKRSFLERKKKEKTHQGELRLASEDWDLQHQQQFESGSAAFQSSAPSLPLSDPTKIKAKDFV